MNIEINPKLQALFTTLAQGQGMTDEAYAVHVIEKYTVSQLRKDTEKLLPALDTDEIIRIKTDITTTLQAKLDATAHTTSEVTPEVEVIASEQQK